MEVPDYRIPNSYDRIVITKPRRSIRTWLLLCSIVGATSIGGLLIVDALAQPPAEFPTNATIEIPAGSGVRRAAAILEEKHVIQSTYLLFAALWWYHDPRALKAGTYRFTEPMNVYAIASKLIAGDFTSNLVHFTHREGERATEIAETAQTTLQHFDSSTFLQLAIPLEGKLFPDTYLVPPDYSAADLVKTMTGAYERNVAPLRPQITASTLTENEVITLASIIEREANSPESMKMVSGVLQNRLKIGMALQTDASIEYILNKPLKDLTSEDLELDSPYNTYSHRELPPTPIGNPGLTAIKSVLEPTNSEYLYYITDSEGDFHYAKSFEDHKKNVTKYLKWNKQTSVATIANFREYIAPCPRAMYPRLYITGIISIPYSIIL